MPVQVATHPLIQHKMTVLRDSKTSAAGFRSVVKEITFYLGYEATRDLHISDDVISTPLQESFVGAKITDSVSIIPVLRAGLGMTDAMLELLPKASVHHIGFIIHSHFSIIESVSFFPFYRNVQS